MNRIRARKPNESNLMIAWPFYDPIPTAFHAGLIAIFVNVDLLQNNLYNLLTLASYTVLLNCIIDIDTDVSCLLTCPCLSEMTCIIQQCKDGQCGLQFWPCGLILCFIIFIFIHQSMVDSVKNKINKNTVTYPAKTNTNKCAVTEVSMANWLWFI